MRQAARAPKALREPAQAKGESWGTSTESRNPAKSNLPGTRGRLERPSRAPPADRTEGTGGPAGPAVPIGAGRQPRRRDASRAPRRLAVPVMGGRCAVPASLSRSTFLSARIHRERIRTCRRVYAPHSHLIGVPFPPPTPFPGVGKINLSGCPDERGKEPRPKKNRGDRGGGGGGGEGVFYRSDESEGISRGQSARQGPILTTRPYGKRFVFLDKT